MFVAEMSEIFPFTVSKFAAASIAHTIEGKTSLISTSVSLYVCLWPRYLYELFTGNRIYLIRFSALHWSDIK